jgi:hypothetical protein
MFRIKSPYNNSIDNFDIGGRLGDDGATVWYDGIPILCLATMDYEDGNALFLFQLDEDEDLQIIGVDDI